MSGEGELLDKDNKLIFKGNYLDNKRNGQGKLMIKEKEFYEGEFKNDKMEGKGSYHYENGDIWEGEFKNDLKNGVGIMTSHNNDVFLYEFENNNYMGSSQLTPEEKAYVKNLQQEERKKLLDNEKNKKKSKENGLDKYTNNLYMQKNLMGLGLKITKINQEVKESEEEKKHKKFLENIELYKKKEPFMIEKFLDIYPLDYEEEIDLIEKNNIKYLGGVVRNKDKPNDLIMKGRGILYDGNERA